MAGSRRTMHEQVVCDEVSPQALVGLGYIAVSYMQMVWRCVMKNSVRRAIRSVVAGILCGLIIKHWWRGRQKNVGAFEDFLCLLVLLGLKKGAQRAGGRDPIPYLLITLRAYFTAPKR